MSPERPATSNSRGAAAPKPTPRRNPMNYSALAGRTAVVTGAASGRGPAPPRLLAAHGAHVALLARREDRLERLAADLEPTAAGRIHVAPVDVTDQTSVDAGAT